MSGIQQDMFLLDCPTYDDYLNTFITRNDLRFLRDKRFCRMLVELGYRSSSEIYTPAEFEKRQILVQETLFPTKKSAMLFSENMISKDPVLIELASRERPNVQKIISTIIFVKHRFKSGFEVSGYIDFEHSLRQANLQTEGHTDWMGIFRERVMLRPTPLDLSYLDWHKSQVYHNHSDNYIVHHDVENGLIFMHRGDHKKICVDISREMYSSNCKRSMHFSEKYGHVIFYDHIVRKKI